MEMPFRIGWMCVCLAAAAAGQDTAGVGSLGGFVRDEGNGTYGGVRVCLAETQRCVESDQDGRFLFSDLRPGNYKLQVGDAGTSADVRAGFDTRLDLTVPRIGVVRESLTVTPEVFNVPEELKSSVYTFTGQDILKSAGTFQDVSRFVQTLPGIAIGSDELGPSECAAPS
jgi:hypothetical protein